MSERKRIEGPSRCNIEPKVWSDPRFRMVAQKTGLDVFSVVGRHARLWAECTTRNVYEMGEDEIDLFAEWPGFAAAMVAYKLARRTDAGVYLCGTKGRVEWLDGMLKQRSAAGVASARERAKQKAAAKSLTEQEAAAKDDDTPSVGDDGPAGVDEEATNGQRPVERQLNERPTSVERQRTSGSGSGSGSDGSSPTVKTGMALDLPAPPSSQPDSETEMSASPRAGARSQAPAQVPLRPSTEPPLSPGEHEAAAKDHDAPAAGDDHPAGVDEEATTGQRPVERQLNETPTSVERQRTSGSGSGSDGSSPTVKTGVALDLPGLSPLQLPDPDSETAKSASPRARAKRLALPYKAAEVYAVLAEAMDGRFISAMTTGGGKDATPKGIAIEAVNSLHEAAELGYTLEDFRLAGEYTLAWLVALGSNVTLTPAWVAQKHADKGGLLKAVMNARAWDARGRPQLSRASPRQLTTRSGNPGISPDDLAAEAEREMAEERKVGLR